MCFGKRTLQNKVLTDTYTLKNQMHQSQTALKYSAI